MSFIERKKAVVHKHHAGLIGRRAELDAVKYSLKQLEARLAHQQKVKDYANLFYVYGPTGVGKTTLLQAIYEDVQKGELGYPPLAVWLDLRQIPLSKETGGASLLLALARAMVGLTAELEPYFKPLFQFWERFNKEGAMAMPPPPPPVSPSPLGGQTAAPRPNPVKNAYGTMASLQANKNQSVQSIARSINRNSTQGMQAPAVRTPAVPPPMQRDISHEIVDLFCKTVDKISASCPVIFFLDHYEAFEQHDDWFRQTLMPAFQREVIMLVAGENNLQDAWTQSFGNVAACFRLRAFSRYETELYFRHFNRLSEPVYLDAIHNLSGGMPVSVAMISSAFQNLVTRSNPAQLMKFLALPDEDYGNQIDKYIMYISVDEFANTDKNMLAGLAMMRSFDAQLFQHLSGVMNVRRTLEHFSQRYPFVSVNGQVSDFVARTLRGYFKQEHEVLYQEVNQSAYLYYLELNRNHPEASAYLFESMYFYFHIDARKAYRHLIQLISHFVEKDLDICDELCQAALDASIPKTWKEEIQRLADALGGYRKKDPKAMQVVQAAITSGQEPPMDEKQYYLNYLEAMN